MFGTLAAPALAQRETDNGSRAEGIAAASVEPGQASAAAAPAGDQYEPIETWSLFEPGKGFLSGRTGAAEVYISACALVRYINQLPANQNFVGHLGHEHAVNIATTSTRTEAMKSASTRRISPPWPARWRPWGGIRSPASR
jgi:hypothetical protein